MAWTYLDDGFFENEKVMAVGGDAQLVYISGLTYCNRRLTGGVILATMVPRLTDRKQPAKLAKRLVEGGLWHEHGHGCPVCPPVEKGAFLVHDYEDMNRSAQARRDKAKKAAAARYSKHAPSSAPSSGGADAGHATSTAWDVPPVRARASGPHSPSPSRDTSSVTTPLLESLRKDEVLHQAVRLLARRHVQAAVDRGVEVRDFDAVVTAEVPKQFDQYGKRLRSLREHYPDMTIDELVRCCEGGQVPVRYRVTPPMAEVERAAPEVVKANIDAARAAVGGQG